ncbi:MAG: hypothetical protein C4K47_05415 [Candidatus Thorarchaeota archaeon]|nr:MAG: hypothetical protein C4K47_05415 [Candidatus Thorarchaeota archaeon]
MHEGHKHLLRTALKLGEWVGIGITTDRLLGEKTDPDRIQNFDERKKSVLEFVKKEGRSERCTMFAVDTKEGGAESMKGLEALIVSDEITVVANAFEINEKRAQNRLPRFHIVVVPRVRTEDGAPLSSSRIRRGESFDRKKLVY